MRNGKTLALVVVGFAGAGTAIAVPTRTTNFQLALPGTTAAATPVLNSNTVSDATFAFRSGADARVPTNGTVQVISMRGRDGKMIYVWRVMVDAASRGGVSGVEIRGFPNVVYDANWRIDGLGTVAPNEVRGAPGEGGRIIGFTFDPSIRPGQSSRYFFLKTNAAGNGPAGSLVVHPLNGGGSNVIVIPGPVR